MRARIGTGDPPETGEGQRSSGAGGSVQSCRVVAVHRLWHGVLWQHV